MTHPHLGMLLETFEKRIGSIYGLKISTAILTAANFLHLSTKGMADELCPIADTQYRQTAHETTEVHLESLRIMNTIRRAAKDDANDIRVVLRVFVVRQNLAERIEFSNTASNELCGL
jgi:hypothetical protein